MHATLPLLKETDFPAITRAKLETLQVNLGYRCNQQCLHCHVNAGPMREENMSTETVVQVLQFLKSSGIKTLDLTGGAPELNPNFRYLVEQARKLDVHVMDRCNLTVLLEPGQEDLAEFLAQQQVEIFASLPCYLEENVDAQRGKGVHASSIAAIKQLNAAGYGIEGSGLDLNFVYNPGGPFLPPPQIQLQADYKRELKSKYDILFNQLFTIANMPIKRFGSTLISKGQFETYMTLLKDAHQNANAETVMCRSLISIDYKGYAFDCDFNQMLDLPLKYNSKPKIHIKDINASELEDLPVVIADHCYGCTAGQGSSCGGALSA